VAFAAAHAAVLFPAKTPSLFAAGILPSALLCHPPRHASHILLQHEFGFNKYLLRISKNNDIYPPHRNSTCSSISHTLLGKVMSILCKLHKIDITKNRSTALPKAKTALQAIIAYCKHAERGLAWLLRTLARLFYFYQKTFCLLLREIYQARYRAIRHATRAKPNLARCKCFVPQICPETKHGCTEHP
jgi:hypothetical protein